MIWNRVLAGFLLTLCAGGLLASWTADRNYWRGFEVLVFGALLVWVAGWVAGKTRAVWSMRYLPLAGVCLWGGIQLVTGWTVHRFATEVDLIRWAVYTVLF